MATVALVLEVRREEHGGHAALARARARRRSGRPGRSAVGRAGSVTRVPRGRGSDRRINGPDVAVSSWRRRCHGRRLPTRHCVPGGGPSRPSRRRGHPASLPPTASARPGSWPGRGRCRRRARPGSPGRSDRSVRRRLGEVQLQDHRLVPVHERRLPGQALEQHAGQGVEVAAKVDLLERGDLLRAHVGRGAHGDARAGEPVAARGHDRPGDAEVEQHRAVGREDDVVGLDVPVDDAVPVGMLERVQQVVGDAGASRPPRAVAALRQALAQGRRPPRRS